MGDEVGAQMRNCFVSKKGEGDRGAFAVQVKRICKSRIRPASFWFERAISVTSASAFCVPNTHFFDARCPITKGNFVLFDMGRKFKTFVGISDIPYAILFWLRRSFRGNPNHLARLFRSHRSLLPFLRVSLLRNAFDIITTCIASDMPSSQLAHPSNFFLLSFNCCPRLCAPRRSRPRTNHAARSSNQ